MRHHVTKQYFDWFSCNFQHTSLNLPIVSLDKNGYRLHLKTAYRLSSFESCGRIHVHLSTLCSSFFRSCSRPSTRPPCTSPSRPCSRSTLPVVLLVSCSTPETVCRTLCLSTKVGLFSYLIHCELSLQKNLKMTSC